MNGFTDVENVAAVLAAELSARQWGWLPSVRGLLRYLTAVLVRRVQRGSSVHPRQSESPTIHADPRTWHVISTALGFCGANFRRPLRVVDVAAAVGYSPSHLCHMISGHLGHTLHEHILGLRINAAEQLLRSSELSISEIAYHVGYDLPHHFSRAFKQATGVSPSAYREMHRTA
jgi:AraC-like DNA-binding protein